MTNKIRDFSRGQFSNIVLVIISTIFGIFAGPVIERLSPPLFSQANLPSLTYILITFTVIIMTVSVNHLWKSTTENSAVIVEEVLKISHLLGQEAKLVSYEEAYREGARWILSANKEVRILTAFAYEFNWKSGKDLYDPERLINPNRKLWFDAITKFIEKTRTSNLRFIRIIEIPRGQNYLTPLKADPPFLKEAELLAQIGKKEPEKACLRISEPYISNTFVLVDGTRLYMEFDIHDPDTKEISAPFVLLAVDPTGDNFRDLLKLHQKLEALSKLVTSIEN